MLQLTQNLKDGAMQMLDVPFPAVSDGIVLVKNHYSVISAGTESKTVRDARRGYLGKALSRKKEVQQVMHSIQTRGLRSTYQTVKNKLEAPSGLGYCCAGEVLAVGDHVKSIRVGDRVSCGGSTAVHAEVVAVPENLCARIPACIDLRHAAFTTVAAIAIQGLRRADLSLGENAVVIGLGLIGLLTVQLLRAAGIRAIGIDIDAEKVALGKNVGAALSLPRSRPDLETIIHDYTRGFGTDAVIITAGTSSLDPIELAGQLCRRKGRVVIVGAVPTGFSREFFYKKELDLRMSCSYGPGRYDPRYEERGIDYPIGYVRWTENRNMISFLDLLADRRIDLEPLITHTFDFKETPSAYNMILERSASFAGILIRYNIEKAPKERPHLLKKTDAGATAKSSVNIGFIGAGSFAQNTLLPAVRGKSNLIGVATAHPNNARYIADKYDFDYCTGNANEITSDKRIDTVFVVTRHNLHAPYVIEALQNGKIVFVEKPLCLTFKELEEIREVYTQRQGYLMVGFNRRFAPHVVAIKQLFLDDQPKALRYRINAGRQPAEHWIHDMDIGGGRILGEVCHFIDLVTYLAGSPVFSLSATTMDEPNHLLDTLSINMRFVNGSIASIDYLSNGNKTLPKEHLEVFCSGQTVTLDDFREMRIFGNKVIRKKLSAQDKGHQQEVVAFLQAIQKNEPMPIPFEQIYHSTLVTLRVLDSIKDQQTVFLP